MRLVRRATAGLPDAAPLVGTVSRALERANSTWSLTRSCTLQFESWCNESFWTHLGEALMTRKFLRSIAAGLLAMLLFAQMAIAAYACPGLSPERVMKLQVTSHAASNDLTSNALMASAGAHGTNCEDMAGEMDLSAPNLCAEHCRFGQQSDQTPPLALPAILLNVRYVLPSLSGAALPPRPHAAEISALAAAAPPHAILHCCFRI